MLQNFRKTLVTSIEQFNSFGGKHDTEDTKLLCTPAAFGELYIHLEHLGNKLSTPTSGMVFGRTEFWLYEQSKGDLIWFLSGEWREHGTVQAIQNFFDDTLQNFRKVDILCQALNVAPLDPRTFGSFGTGFLGHGAFGLVVRVIPRSTSSRPREQHLAALKFVQHTNDTKLSQLKCEFRVLTRKCRGYVALCYNQWEMLLAHVKWYSSWRNRHCWEYLAFLTHLRSLAISWWSMTSEFDSHGRRPAYHFSSILTKE